MKIGVISDTHDHLKNVEQAFSELSKHDVNIVCHLGDWISPFMFDLVDRQAKQLKVQVKGVLGNNDGEVFKIVSQSKIQWDIEIEHHTLSFEVDGNQIVLYHGTDQRITDALMSSGQYNAVFFGHTHEQEKIVEGNTLLLNPGTLSGFSKKRGKLNEGELAIYDSEKNKAQLLAFPLA